MRARPTAIDPYAATVPHTRGGLRVVLTIATALGLPALVVLAFRGLEDRPAAATGALVLTITLAAVVGGRVGGVIATAAAATGQWYFLIPPRDSFRIEMRSDVIVLIVLVFCGVAVTGIVELVERSRRAAELEAARVRRLHALTSALDQLGPEDELELACARLGAEATQAAWAEVSGVDGDTVERYGRDESPLDAVVTVDTDVAVAGRGVAAYRVRFGYDSPPDRATRALAESIARQCGSAFERLLYRRAELIAQSEQELVAKAASLLSAAPDVVAVSDALRDLVVPEFADTCTVTARDDAGIGSVALPHDGVPAIVLPLVARDDVIADLVLTRRDGFDPVRRTVASQLAELAAQALDRALLYDEQSRTSYVLQRSLLPKALLQTRGLDVAARYLAAGERTEVGGDFYDAVRHDDGSMTLIIGDVQGKGLEAATLNALARQTLRAFALLGKSPSEMLRGLNNALLYTLEEKAAAGDDDPLRLVTSAVVHLWPQGRRFAGVASCGGHPLPIIVRANGTLERAGAIGTVLGLLPDPDLSDAPLELDLADTIVLYTDGVTDVHDGTRFLGEEDLGRVIRNRLDATSADAVAQLVESTVLSVAVSAPRDDIAVVVARVVH